MLDCIKSFFSKAKEVNKKADKLKKEKRKRKDKRIMEEDIDKIVEELKIDEGYREQPYIDTQGIVTIGYGTNLEELDDGEILTILENEDFDIKVNNPKYKIGTLEVHTLHNRISKDTAKILLENKVRTYYKDTKEAIINEYSRSMWTMLSPIRRQTLVNMAYNMGVNGLMLFTNMFTALRKKKFEEAADEMLNSQWHQQVGRRAERLAKQMHYDKHVEYNDDGTVE